jgi:hypothetical protein
LLWFLKKKCCFLKSEVIASQTYTTQQHAHAAAMPMQHAHAAAMQQPCPCWLLLLAAGCCWLLLLLLRRLVESLENF